MNRAEQLLQRRDKIRIFLGNGAIDILCFLQSRFAGCDPATDRLFQFVFTHFYRLDHARLPNDLISACFEILRDHKGGAADPEKFAEKLHTIPNNRGGESLHISFVSKVCATIDPTHPIYDKHVKEFYGLPERYTNQGFERRLAGFVYDFAKIRNGAIEILAHRGIHAMVADVRARFPAATPNLIPDLRVIDLFVYAHGVTADT